MPRLSRIMRRQAAVWVAVIAVLPLIATPAFAARVVVHDGRGDVWKVEEGGTEGIPAPRATIGDFVRTNFVHTNTRIRVKAKFVQLERTGRRLVLWVDMRDQDGKKTIAGVRAGRGNRDGSALLLTNRGRDIDCNIRHSIDYKENTVRVGFPRQCIDSPRYLRFRAMSEHIRRDWAYAYLDNPHNNQAFSSNWSQKVRRG